MASANTRNLENLADLVQQQQLKMHIDKTYPYTGLPAAVTYIEKMHARGKVVIDWTISEF